MKTSFPFSLWLRSLAKFSLSGYLFKGVLRWLGMFLNMCMLFSLWLMAPESPHLIYISIY